MARAAWARLRWPGGEVIASPAIADGRLFIRAGEKLYCIADETK